MTAFESILDGLADALALERDLGERAVECDRSAIDALLAPAPAPPPPVGRGVPSAPSPSAPPPAAKGLAALPSAPAMVGRGVPSAPPPSAPLSAPPPPSPSRFDIAFLHDRPLSPKAADMMGKIAAAMGRTPETAPVAVFGGATPPAKVYVVLGSLALRAWLPGAAAGPGTWLRMPSGEEALVTYSPEKIVRFATVTPAVMQMKREMWNSLKDAMRRAAAVA